MIHTFVGDFTECVKGTIDYGGNPYLNVFSTTFEHRHSQVVGDKGIQASVTNIHRTVTSKYIYIHIHTHTPT